MTSGKPSSLTISRFVVLRFPKSTSHDHRGQIHRGGDGTHDPRKARGKERGLSEPQ